MACAVSPTPEAWISSPYGMRPGRTTGETRLHAGLDLRGEVGEPIRNAFHGTVETIVHDDGRAESVLDGITGRAFRGYGNVVVIKHPDGTWSSYNHLDSIAVRPGQILPTGALVGTLGNTSNGRFPGMGPHLHFEVRTAKSDGSSPFPAPYGALNVDPAEWLEGHGVRVEGRRLVPDDSPCPFETRKRTIALLSGGAALATALWLGAGAVGGLGGLERRRRVR